MTSAKIVEPRMGVSVTQSETVGEVAGKVPEIADVRKEYEESRYQKEQNGV